MEPTQYRIEPVSFTRRGGRLNPRQQSAWDELAPVHVLDLPRGGTSTSVDPSYVLDQRAIFGRDAPLVVEIGSGIGEATAALAPARAAYDVLALEVWRPGIADALARVADSGATNVRFCSVDAVWSMQHLLHEGEVAELWTFFPDPWHKKKHHKRRLVTPTFAALAASRLAPGAEWRLATDWGDYAEQMVDVLDAEPLLTGGVVERWAERPVTKFERKGLAAGRDITDLAYRRL